MSHVLDHYNYLHTIPELGMQEFKTSAYLADKLEAAGYEVTRNVGGATGIVGVLDSGKPGPVLAVRADMDALGTMIEGKLCALHTCGHDGHSSMLLTAAEEIAKEGGIKQGKLKILFQPAEEIGTGAYSMIEGGAIDDVEYIIGMHLRPIQECRKGQAAPAMYYSASTRVEVNIHGVPAHGARPHLGVNVLEAAAAIIQAVGLIHLNPVENYSAKPTRLLCDSGVTNAIPAEAHLVFDVRAAKNDIMKQLHEKLNQAITAGAATVGATVDIAMPMNMPAAEIDPEVTKLLAEVITEELGADALVDPIQTPGSEDFFCYTQAKPSLKAGFIGLGVDLEPGLHHPKMHFDTTALENGVRLHKAAIRKLLG